jgi:hypothetical protein
MVDPRAHRLRAMLGGSAIRRSSADREFLHDLARVGLIDAEMARTHHYPRRKSDVRARLDSLCAAGLLERVPITLPRKGRFAACRFANERVARAWGGRMPVFGRNRTAFHDLITTRVYFELGRPRDFRVEARFSDADRALFGPPPGVGRGTHYGVRGSCPLPDALYTDALGEVVVVEADAGQYIKAQIAHKQGRWRAFKQVWGQPETAFARIAPTAEVQVVKL